MSDITPGVFTSDSDGLVPASSGGTNFLRADGTWVAVAGGGALAMSQHVIGVDTTITAGYSAVVSRYVEVSAGFTLEIGADGDLEIT